MDQEKLTAEIKKALEPLLMPIIQDLHRLKQERIAAPVTAKSANDEALVKLQKQVDDLKAELQKANIEQVDFSGSFGADFGPRGQWEDDASFTPAMGVHENHNIDGEVFAGIFGGGMRKYDHSGIAVEKGVYSGFNPPVRRGVVKRLPRLRKTIDEI